MKILDTYGILKDLNPELGEFVDPRDNQKYQTIKLDGIEWFRENLNYDSSHEIGKGAIELFELDPPSMPGEGQCGRYYSFNNAINDCPEGWEIPKRDVWIDLFKKITKKNPNEWEDNEKRMIYYSLVGKSSILNLGLCGKYESRKEFGIWGSSRIAHEREEILLMYYPQQGHYLTSTPGSREDAGSVFGFIGGLKKYTEQVGFGKYTVRPIRKNI
jgi:hypothetical protein